MVEGYDYLMERLKSLGKVEKKIGDGDFYIIVNPLNVHNARTFLDNHLGIGHYSIVFDNYAMFYRIDFNTLKKKEEK
jgi:hypothetical protein